VDKLRRLNVTQEGIPLPTIVVVGDQSSGKSSVLESLAGISLPRGQGICTRVPLIMRLQHHNDLVPEFRLEFETKTVKIVDESGISEAIDKATVEIAGKDKGISNKPLTLVVKKKGVPDLTMVDLPGITRVPVHGQPENIYDQISGVEVVGWWGGEEGWWWELGFDMMGWWGDVGGNGLRANGMVRVSKWWDMNNEQFGINRNFEMNELALTNNVKSEVMGC
ncbi:dynamin-related protein 4C-like protein, partial [Tanacetum coccineum]